MAKEENSYEGDGESLPILEVVPLPAKFPDDKPEMVNVGEIGVFGLDARPTGSRGAEARDALVSMIAANVFISDYDSEWMFQEREMMLPQLFETHAQLVESGETTPEHLLGVRRFLWLLRAPESFQWMAESLEVEQPQRSKNLEELQQFVMFRRDTSPLLCEEPLRTALLHCLHDPVTRNDALRTAFDLEMPEASEVLFEAVISQGDFPETLHFTKAQWNGAQQEAVIRVIAKRLESSDEQETRELLYALRWKWIEPEEKNILMEMQRLALQVAEDFFLNSANIFHKQAIETLVRKGSAACLNEAERLAFQEKNAEAIQLYARLAENRLRPDFIDFLSDPNAVHATLAAMGQMPPEGLKPEWIAPLTALLKGHTEKGAQTILGRMGREGIEAAKQHYKTLPMPLVWREQGLTLHAAAVDLVRFGLVDSQPEIDLKLDPGDSEGLKSLLSKAGILFGFDSEHDFVPVPHHDLLMKCAAHSRGRFRPLHPRQFLRNPGTEEVSYLVEFAHAGKLVRFSALDLNDWFDVVAVLKGANLALEAAGEPGRFLVWPEMDQVVTVVFGPVEKWQEFARLYAMPLDASFADLDEISAQNLAHHQEISATHTELISNVKAKIEGSQSKPNKSGAILSRILSFLAMALLVSLVRWCSHR